MEENMEKVQQAWQAIRKIQQLVEAYGTGGFTIPGTNLVYEFSAEQIQQLKQDFVEQKNLCITALNGITA